MLGVCARRAPAGFGEIGGTVLRVCVRFRRGIKDFGLSDLPLGLLAIVYLIALLICYCRTTVAAQAFSALPQL